MIAFVYQMGNEIHLTYSANIPFGGTYLGCGNNREELYDLVKTEMSRDAFLQLYQKLLKGKLNDWTTNPFESMKKEDFLKKYQYEKGERLS